MPKGHGTKRPATPRQLVAARNSLVKARQVEHQKHPAGRQTPKQLAAERHNLMIARGVLKQEKAAKKSAPSGNNSTITQASAPIVSAAYARRKHGRSRTAPAPLGIARIAASLEHKQTLIRKPTGTNRRFQARISPNSFDQRTAWKKAKAHHFKKRLHMRKVRVAHVKDWRRHRGRLTPR